MTKFLASKDFQQSKSDYSLFTKEHAGKYTYILVYVNDLLVSSDDGDSIAMIKKDLHTAFTIKDLV